MESDFNLDFHTGNVRSDIDSFGFASAAGVGIPGISVADGTLDGSDGGILSLTIEGSGFVAMNATPAAAAEFGDSIVFTVVSFEGTARNPVTRRTQVVEVRDGTRVRYGRRANLDEELLPAGDRWGENDDLVIRLEGAGKWLLPDGTFANVGDQDPNGEIIHKKGYYAANDDGEWVYVRFLEIVDQLPEADPGKIVYVTDDYRAPYVAADFDLDFTVAALNTNADSFPGYADAGAAAADSRIASAGGSLEGASTVGINALVRNGTYPEIIVSAAGLAEPDL